jgi:hypothetical protein
LSTTLWGGAGMLARSAYFRVPYDTHPLRGHLVRACGFVAGPTSASTRVKSFIEGQRAQLFQRADDGGFFARLNLPPIVAIVAEQANSADELIPVALELRESFAELRGWLGQWQEALAAENIETVLKFQSTLQSVARHLDAVSSFAPVGETSVQLGLSWLKLTFKTGSPVNSLANQFGVRAELNRLALAAPGHNAVKKLIEFVGGTENLHGVRLQQDILNGGEIFG